MPLDQLIDKQDSFELVRDQIAAILVIETANQMALATAAAKDPDLWKLRVYTETSNPWEQFLDIDPGTTDISPIVNVWYDNGTFPKSQGDPVNRQNCNGIFNIDCYAVGISEQDGAGHKPGDTEAALNVHRAIRLIRNILMAGENTYLQLDRKTIGAQRWIQSITVFQPPQGENTVQHVIGARIALETSFNEFSPQATPETLELLTVDVKRTEDGQIVLEADYDYTA